MSTGKNAATQTTTSAKPCASTDRGRRRQARVPTSEVPVIAAAGVLTNLLAKAMVGGVAHSGRVAVLLDAALVRLLLVPVLPRLLGRRAWWLPEPLHRVLPDVRFGHAAP